MVCISVELSCFRIGQIPYLHRTAAPIGPKCSKPFSRDRRRSPSTRTETKRGFPAARCWRIFFRFVFWRNLRIGTIRCPIRNSISHSKIITTLSLAALVRGTRHSFGTNGITFRIRKLELELYFFRFVFFFLIIFLAIAMVSMLWGNYVIEEQFPAHSRILVEKGRLNPLNFSTNKFIELTSLR